MVGVVWSTSCHLDAGELVRQLDVGTSGVVTCFYEGVLQNPFGEVPPDGVNRSFGGVWCSE
jgi:hypothetical protein